MPTYASRDTSTGLIFENAVQMKKIGVELTKHKLYSFLKEQNGMNTFLVNYYLMKHILIGKIMK